jgi:hypothetical protein
MIHGFSRKNMTPRSLATKKPFAYLKKIWKNTRLGTRVIGLLCLLPILEKFHTLPALLERLAPIRPRKEMPDAFAMEQVVSLVLGICHRRPFRSRIFPKACLRQSLVLYHTLTHMGYPVEFHLGVRKKGEDFIAHSWIAVEGKPVADTTTTGELKIVYAYPNNVNSTRVTNGGHHGREKIAAAGA